MTYPAPAPREEVLARLERGGYASLNELDEHKLWGQGPFMVRLLCTSDRDFPSHRVMTPAELEIVRDPGG